MLIIKENSIFIYIYIYNHMSFNILLTIDAKNEQITLICRNKTKKQIIIFN